MVSKILFRSAIGVVGGLIAVLFYLIQQLGDTKLDIVRLQERLDAISAPGTPSSQEGEKMSREDRKADKDKNVDKDKKSERPKKDNVDKKAQ